MKHLTDGRPCWCRPRLEQGVVIHRATWRERFLAWLRR